MKISYKGNKNIFELLDKLKEYLEKNYEFQNCTNANIYLKLEDDNGNKLKEDIYLKIANNNTDIEIIDIENQKKENTKIFIINKIFNEKEIIHNEIISLEKELKTINNYLNNAEKLKRKESNIIKREHRKVEVETNLNNLNFNLKIINLMIDKVKKGEYLYSILKTIDYNKKYNFNISANFIFRDLLNDNDEFIFLGNDPNIFISAEYINFGNNIYYKFQSDTLTNEV